MNPDYIFVTVGTTKFDKLIKSVTTERILRLLKENGFKNLILQIGNTKYIPEGSNLINIDYYNLKESIKDDIRRARVVISHSGAGSCLEVLSMKKPLIAVVNDDLMGNHQIELAKKLADKKYIFYCSCNNLYETLEMALTNLDSLKKYPDGNIELFSNYVNKCVGFCD